ncbi:MAG: HAD-IIB family hydrolase [Myxococcales bacterium]
MRAIFTDIDGTLTTGGKLLPSTYRALWDWKQAGGLTVLVTGRAAGWAEGFFRLWPVDAAIAENGGIAFVQGARGIERIYAFPQEELERERRRMRRAAHAVEKQVPGAALSSDSRYTEVDLAIDYNEERRLGPKAAGEIERILRSRGFSAVRSSVHVNFWPGDFDKLSTARLVARRLRLRAEELAYVGDSFNDQPMFRGLPLTIGVADVRDVLDQLEHRPRYLTRARAGKGFEEVVRALLRARTPNSKLPTDN